MNIPEFLEKNKGLNLADISWDEFPEELKAACWRFINQWFEEIPMDDLREISGFDEMNLFDLLKQEGLRNG